MSDKKDVIKELDRPIPRGDVAERAAGFGGKTLSYLEGWYVVNRLNKVIGQGNWSYNILGFSKVFEGELKGKFACSYTCQVQLIVSIDGKSCSYMDIGFGDGFDKANPGKAHELATKESVTDAVKRCARNLGMSFGLALYDKSQEFVEEEKVEKKKPKAVVSSTDITVELLESIGSISKELVVNQRFTKQDLLNEMGARYGVKDKSQLSLEKAEEFLTWLKKENTNG